MERRTFIRWAPVVLWAAAILAVSSIPGRHLHIPEGTDKVGHVGEYLVLGALLARSLGARAALRLLVAAWLGMAVFGALDELHQYFIPGRTPDVMDWAADAAGAGAGLLAGWAFYRLRARWNRSPAS